MHSSPIKSSCCSSCCNAWSAKCGRSCGTQQTVDKTVAACTSCLCSICCSGMCFAQVLSMHPLGDAWLGNMWSIRLYTVIRLGLVHASCANTHDRSACAASRSNLTGYAYVCNRTSARQITSGHTSLGWAAWCCGRSRGLLPMRLLQAFD